MLASNRATNILLILMLAVGIGIVAMLASGVRGGPIDPPRPPSSTQSNLIYQPADCSGFPITLSTTGSWALAENITMPAACAKAGIVINANGITLDLRGFAVRGVAGATAGVSVTCCGTENATVENGTISGWPAGGLAARGASDSRFHDLILTLNGPATAGGAQLELGSSDVLSNCTVAEGVGTNTLGILVVGYWNVVENCLVQQNTAQGMKVDGGRNRIARNHATFNATTTGCADYWITGFGNIVEENTASTHSSDTCPFYIDGAATGSIVHRNVARGSGSTNFVNFCGSDCDVGPIGTAGSSSSPWANISD